MTPTPTETKENLIIAAGALTGNPVHNGTGESLGRIEAIMLDTSAGRIAYAVLSFGGFLGIGDKLFAVPWDALDLDPSGKKFFLDVEKEVLDSAPGFDKENWPDMADESWHTQIHGHWGTTRY